MEILIQFFFEFVLQVVLEVLFELGVHSVVEPFRRKPNAWMAAFGYFLIGGLLGALSVLVIGHHLVTADWRIANLVFTPILAGIAMTLLGRWRAQRGDEVLRIDRFAYGYLFALAFALARFALASLFMS